MTKRFKIIDFIDIINQINCFSKKSSYQICFLDDNFNDFSTREIEVMKKLNFCEIYEKYNSKVDDIYNNMLCLIKNFENSEKFEEAFEKIYGGNKTLENKILTLKYVYSKNILKNELNKEKYVDFIFQIIYRIPRNYCILPCAQKRGGAIITCN